MQRIQIDGAQDFSRVCMCIEFVIQVLKQKNAHVSFPVGMVMFRKDVWLQKARAKKHLRQEAIFLVVAPEGF